MSMMLVANFFPDKSNIIFFGSWNLDPKNIIFMDKYCNIGGRSTDKVELIKIKVLCCV